MIDYSFYILNVNDQNFGAHNSFIIKSLILKPRGLHQTGNSLHLGNGQSREFETLVFFYVLILCDVWTAPNIMRFIGLSGCRLEWITMKTKLFPGIFMSRDIHKFIDLNKRDMQHKWYWVLLFSCKFMVYSSSSCSVCSRQGEHFRMWTHCPWLCIRGRADILVSESCSCVRLFFLWLLARWKWNRINHAEFSQLRCNLFYVNICI